MAEKHKSIILGITGASGTVYGLRLLEYLLSQGYVVDVVFSNNALKVSKLELDQDWEGLN
jgi:4-hydroxy-3-polyprenylbenzoate decarboxylase